MDDIVSYQIVSDPAKRIRQYFCVSGEIVANWDEKNQKLEKHSEVKQVLNISYIMLAEKEKKHTLYKVGLISSNEFVSKNEGEVAEPTFVDIIDVKLFHETGFLEFGGYDPIEIITYFGRCNKEYIEIMKKKPKIQPFIIHLTDWETMQSRRVIDFHSFVPKMSTPEHRQFVKDCEAKKVVGEDNIPNCDLVVEIDMRETDMNRDMNRDAKDAAEDRDVKESANPPDLPALIDAEMAHQRRLEQERMEESMIQAALERSHLFDGSYAKPA